MCVCMHIFTADKNVLNICNFYFRATWAWAFKVPKVKRYVFVED